MGRRWNVFANENGKGLRSVLLANLFKGKSGLGKNPWWTGGVIQPNDHTFEVEEKSSWMTSSTAFDW